MKAHVIGNAAADDTQKLGAFLNARMRSTVCESNFSAAQKKFKVLACKWPWKLATAAKKSTLHTA